jgi:hypothetical protein
MQKFYNTVCWGLGDKSEASADIKPPFKFQKFLMKNRLFA